MKAVINFHHSSMQTSWSMSVISKGKSRVFYLGQDVKFIRRVLGYDPSAMLDEFIADYGIKSRDSLFKWSNRRRCNLAEFILGKLNLHIDEIMDLDPWSLSAD